MSRLYEKITTKAASSCCIKQENHQQAVAQDTDSNKVPHNYKKILENSDLDLLHRPLFITSDKMIIQQLHDGVFLSDRKMFYWVDKKKNNCFRIFPNGLTITSLDNSNCWSLRIAQTSDLGKITVAKLQPGVVVTWKISGGINTGNLSPGVTYQVAFEIMLEYISYGWEEPMSFGLTLPKSEEQLTVFSFKDNRRGEWFRIPVRDFEVPQEIDSKIEFSLYQNGKTPKKGLIMKSLIIEPK